jgi:hypothetical protein
MRLLQRGTTRRLGVSVGALRELVQSWKNTGRLQPRFYALTSIVGLIGVGAGCALMVVAARFLESTLGIAPKAALGDQANGVAWLVLFLASIPIAIYAGVVAVAGALGAVMVLLGKCTPGEAVRYALLSKYPRYWLRR